jgi:hypothetical protein
VAKQYKLQKLQRTAKVVTLNKNEAYNCLESVQAFFNTQPLRLFKGDTPEAKDMCEKMKALGLDIN